MRLMYKDDPMFDQDFLNELFSAQERELYAKIVALNLDEFPIEEIEGRVTSGSVSVDGSSAVRRTCSLSLVANELNISDYLWGLKTKVRLFIGLKNKINDKYPDIIWFKMGTYVLTTFSTSFSSSGYTISLQGKDKMCLLNGDVGGSLTALSYDFGTVDVTNKDGYTYNEKLPLKQIIKKAVHDYAKEPYHNIIVNDLDDNGLELLEYRGTDPLYFIYNPKTLEVANMVIDQNQSYYVNGKAIKIEEIEKQIEQDNKADKKPTYVYKMLTGDAVFNEQFLEPTKFYGDAAGTQGPYNIIKIETGMTCGYRTTELVYAGDLTSAVGESITAMIDKIVSMLGNYEYFYNKEGQFVFQKKRTYVNTSWNNMVNNGEEDWVENAAYTSSYTFSFENGNLITSYQNSPNYANLKNDFSIWGTRTGASGSSIPVHMRYAIDSKPDYYTNTSGVLYTTKSEEEIANNKEYTFSFTEGHYNLDWRELIYQMALDFNKHGDEDDFIATIRKNNLDFYPTGYTGYEQYYVDMEGFWRQLYNPDYKTSYDIINLTKRKFEEEARFHTPKDEEPWYYDAPVYTQCKEDDIFYSSVNYYCLIDGEYELQKGLIQTTYNEDRTKYYRITDTEIQPISIITESFNPSENIYYIYKENQGYIAVDTPVEDDLIDYHFRQKSELSYFPCYQIEAFVIGRTYFTYEVKEGATEGSYVSTTVKEDEYLKSPGVYYKRTITNGVVNFVNCTTLQPYNEERHYYKYDKNKELKEVKEISEENYESEAYDGLMYSITSYTYTPVIHSKYEYDESSNYYIEGEKEYYLDPEADNCYWNKAIDESPESLNFWIDFLDTYGELSEYSVQAVGDRPKAVNDTNVKAIYFRETPGVIFVENLNDLDINERETGYTYAQLPAHLEYLFTISSQGKSAKDVLDDYLYSYSYCTESITIAALPIYSLEPNTRIFVRDDNSGINGEYIVSKLSFPLDANGTMSINATKVVDRIY